MCPECGSQNLEFFDFDFGIDPANGYSDSGEGFRCLDCMANGNAEGLAAATNSEPETAEGNNDQEHDTVLVSLGGKSVKQFAVLLMAAGSVYGSIMAGTPCANTPVVPVAITATPSAYVGTCTETGVSVSDLQATGFGPTAGHTMYFEGMSFETGPTVTTHFLFNPALVVFPGDPPKDAWLSGKFTGSDIIGMGMSVMGQNASVYEIACADSPSGCSMSTFLGAVSAYVTLGIDSGTMFWTAQDDGVAWWKDIHVGGTNGAPGHLTILQQSVYTPGGETPEPATAALMGAGLIGIVIFARRKSVRA